LKRTHDKSDQSGDPLTLLGGTSLRVYLLLLTSGRSLGVREVQRALGFRSPSTARHHLERLVELGLAKPDGWGYRALEPSGILSQYVFIHGRFLPKAAFLTGFLLASTLLYAIMPGRDLRALVFLVIASILSLFETLRVHRALRRILSSDTRQ